MTVRTVRGNRTGLAILGLLLLAAGAYLLLRGTKVLGTGQSATDPVYTPATASWVHDQRPWIWLTLAIIAVIVALLAVRWLLVQLRTDRLGRITLDRPDPANLDTGRTDLPTGALTTAVGQEIDAYPGVRTVKAQMTGTPHSPTLILHVTADPDADLPRLHQQIIGEAVAHARSALNNALPTTLQLSIAARARPKQNPINQSV